jgi:hypothetical protein
MPLSAHKRKELSPQRATAFERATASDRCSCGFALDPRSGRVAIYNEPAFHFFLDLESRRSEATNRPLVLLVVQLMTESNASLRFDSMTVEPLFIRLSQCLREVDLLGWYRQDYAAAGLLTHFGDQPLTDSALVQVSGRVTRALVAGLPGHVARHLQIRVSQPLAGVEP